jgi:hypothetical protein
VQRSQKLLQSLPKVERILLSATIAATFLAKKFGFHGRFDEEMFHATCVATDAIERQVTEEIAP